MTSCFCSDNASVNSGKSSGVIALLEERRKKDFEGNHEPGEVLLPTIHIGCADHVVNIASRNVHKEIAEIAKKLGFSSLLPPNGYYANNIHWLTDAITKKLSKGPLKDIYLAFCLQTKTEKISWSKVSLCRYQSVDVCCSHILHVLPALLVFFKRLGDYDATCRKISHFLEQPEILLTLSICACASERFYRPLMEIAAKVTDMILFNKVIEETKAFLEDLKTGSESFFSKEIQAPENIRKRVEGVFEGLEILTLVAGKETGGGEEVSSEALVLTRDLLAGELSPESQLSLTSFLSSKGMEVDPHLEEAWSGGLALGSTSSTSQLQQALIGGFCSQLRDSLQKHLLSKKNASEVEPPLEAFRATNRSGERTLALWDIALRVNKNTRIDTIENRIKIKAIPESIDLFQAYPGVNFREMAKKRAARVESTNQRALRRMEILEKENREKIQKLKKKEEEMEREDPVKRYLGNEKGRTVEKLTNQMMVDFLKEKKEKCGWGCRVSGKREFLIQQISKWAKERDPTSWNQAQSYSVEEPESEEDEDMAEGDCE